MKIMLAGLLLRRVRYAFQRTSYLSEIVRQKARRTLRVWKSKPNR